MDAQLSLNGMNVDCITPRAGLILKSRRDGLSPKMSAYPAGVARAELAARVVAALSAIGLT